MGLGAGHRYQRLQPTENTPRRRLHVLSELHVSQQPIGLEIDAAYFLSRFILIWAQEAFLLN